MYPHFLANLGYDTIYVPREKIEARCEQEDHNEQQAPHLTCMCGIYAYKEKPRLLREIRHNHSGWASIPAVRLVYGEINLWGKVIEHEDGYRAQFGYPKRLWCTPAIEPLAGWIGYVYGVPCEVMPSGDDEEIKIKSPRWKPPTLGFRAFRPDPKTVITKYACGHELTSKVEYKNWWAYIRDMRKAPIFYDVGFCPKCFVLNIKAQRMEK